MRKTILLLVILLLLSNYKLMAQNWVNGGNSLSANGRLGTNTNFSLIFETNNTERGRITNGGNWGFGTSSPGAKFHVNSAAGANALRASVNGATKLLVHSAGGVSVGSGSTPPTNGLYVAGNAGFGITTPGSKVHINSAAGQFPLRVQANSLTGLLVHDNLGVSVGSAAIPPANGLSVNIGNAGFGTSAPGNYRVKILHGQHGLNLQQSSTGNHWEIWTSTNNFLALYYNTFLRGDFNSNTGAYFSISDERLKTNIKAMPSVLEKVNRLKPTTYQFKDVAATANAKATEESYPDSYGFLAQDVMKVFPHLVTHHVNEERDLDTYTLDYSGFGVIAIKAIQELQQTNQEQLQKISTLEDRIAKLEATLGLGGNGKNSGGKELIGVSLEQNYPNPFDQSTTFRYTIPAGATAQILIHDVTSGSLVKSIPAPASGQAQINANELKPGIYSYTLVVNGQAAASKTMMLNK
jgi:hypothetical protein